MKGPGVDLNYIDTSEITDMTELISELFRDKDISVGLVGSILTLWKLIKNIFRRYLLKIDIKPFILYPDISRWDTGNVRSMREIFKNTKFNGDISLWNTSNVENMEAMFYESDFNGDILAVGM